MNKIRQAWDDMLIRGPQNDQLDQFDHGGNDGMARVDVDGLDDDGFEDIL